MKPPFRDRSDAGRVLAESLSRYSGVSGLVVLGLARGGVAVARPVADALGAPLGVLVSRRLTFPGVDEVALGAIAEGSRRVVLDTAAHDIGVPARVLERLAELERIDLERCASLYHAGSPPIDLRGRIVLLVDDGVATGVTMRAAAHVVRRARPARLIAAVPIASRWGAQRVAAEVDELSAVVTATTIEALSSGYQDHAPVTDDEVLELLGRRTRRISPIVRDISDRIGVALSRVDHRLDHRERAIAIPIPGGAFTASLGMPPVGVFARELPPSDHVRGLVVLAHTDEGDRNPFFNRYLAGRLRLGGFATLRLDLVTKSEQRLGIGSARTQFDLARVAARLADVCDWLAREGVAGAQRTMLVGAGTAATAALAVASRRPAHVRGIIVRAGRVDLPIYPWSHARASVLMIFGADQASASQRDALLSQLPVDAELMRVPHPAHALDEPDAIGFVAERIVDWLDTLDRQDRKRLRRPSRG